MKLTKVVLALLVVCCWIRNSNDSIRACSVRYHCCGGFWLPTNLKGSRHKRFLSKPATRSSLSVDFTGRILLLLLLLSGDVEQNPGPVNERTEHICPICEDPVLDAKGRKKGQDAIFCDGTCQSLLHRRCAGLSRSAFQTKVSCSKEFYCRSCRLTNLETSVSDMLKELTMLKSLMSAKPSTVGSDSKSRQDDDKLTTSLRSYSSAVSGDLPPQPLCTNTIAASSKSSLPEASEANRKYNIVVFGIGESQQGTPCLKRWKNDRQAVQSVLNSLEEGSGHTGIMRDCRRIGRYVPNKGQTRPILVSLSSTMDVANVLSRRRLLQRPISVRADLSPRDRETESILLHQRWKLIRSGLSRTSIKIKNSSLLVNGSLYGKVSGSDFRCHLTLHFLAN